MRARLALAHLGQVEAGRSELAAGIEASKSIMGQAALPQFSAMMAEVLLLQNDIAGAEAWLARAIDVENANDDRYFSAEIHRLSAICRACHGQVDLALVPLQKAIDVSRSQGARFFELRAALTLAQHDPKHGRAALRSVVATVPEREPWPEVEAARRILD